jgi:hypothetical protein
VQSSPRWPTGRGIRKYQTGGKCSMHGKDEKNLVYYILGDISEVNTLANLWKIGRKY